MEKLRHFLWGTMQSGDPSDAEEDTPHDTSYGIFRKEPVVYAPISVASTAVTSSFPLMYPSNDETDTFAASAMSNNPQGVHRKWQELAETWKTTAGAPGSPEKQTKQLGITVKNDGLGNNRLMKLSPLSSSQHSRSSALGDTSSSFLWHTPVMTTKNAPNTTITTSTFSTPDRPFRPYGFDWSSTPQSRGARTSRLTVYTNMCVFDRLYGQAKNVPQCASPNRVPTPNKIATEPKQGKSPTENGSIKKPNKPCKSPAAVDEKKYSSKIPKFTTPKTNTHSSSAISKQPWKSSSRHPRPFSRGIPPPVTTGKGKTQLHGTITVPSIPPLKFTTNNSSKSPKQGSSPSATIQAKPGSPSRRKKDIPKPATTSMARAGSRSLSPARRSKASPKCPAEKRSVVRSQSPPSKQQPASKSPGRTPKSFQLRTAVAKSKVKEQDKSMIQLRMQRTKKLKETEQQPPSRSLSPVRNASPLPWSTPSGQRLQHPLDSSSAQRDLERSNRKSESESLSNSRLSLALPVLQSSQNANNNDAMPAPVTPSVNNIVTPEASYRQTKDSPPQITPNPSHSDHIAVPQSESPLACFSPMTIAGAKGVVQSAYRDSLNSIEHKQELVAIYRQERQKVGLHIRIQHPRQRQLEQQNPPDVVTPASALSPIIAKPASPGTSGILRAKWKAKQPMFKRHTAAVKIQRWYKGRVAEQKRLKLIVKRRLAARTIQVLWRKHRKLLIDQVADRKAAEMLQLCWWRKLSKEESERTQKATARSQHSYSHIPQQVQDFVRGAREKQAAERQGAKLLQLCWWRELSKEEKEREAKVQLTAQSKFDKIPREVKNFVLSSRERQEKALRAARLLQQWWRRRDVCATPPFVPEEPIKSAPPSVHSLAPQNDAGIESIKQCKGLVVVGQGEIEEEAEVTAPCRSDDLAEDCRHTKASSNNHVSSLPIQRQRNTSTSSIKSPTGHVGAPSQVAVSSPVNEPSGKAFELPIPHTHEEACVNLAASERTTPILAVQVERSEKPLSSTDLIVTTDASLVPKMRRSLSIGRPRNIKADVTARNKRSASVPTKKASTKPVIDLDGIYRQAFAVRRAELLRRRANRIRATRRIQDWWTMCLLVATNRQRRKIASTTLQAVYRGHRYSLVLCHLRRCSIFIQRWWRERRKARVGAIVFVSGWEHGLAYRLRTSLDSFTRSPASKPRQRSSSLERDASAFGMLKRVAWTAVVFATYAWICFIVLLFLLFLAMFWVDGLVSVKRTPN